MADLLQFCLIFVENPLHLHHSSGDFMYIYIRLLVKFYRFLGRRTRSKFAQIVLEIVYVQNS